MRLRKIILSLAGIIILGAVVGLYLGPAEPGGEARSRTIPGGDPSAGRQAIIRHGCVACHVIAGIGRATGRVGPKLLEIKEQIYLGGVVPNTPEGMIKWIQNPRKFSTATAMPDLGVSERDARDIAAYLYETGD